MLFLLVLSAITASIRAQSTAPFPSQYLNSVCSPNLTNPDPIPPCISIISIESACSPNGTSPLAYEAAAQCLCSPPSTFFADWLGCRACLTVHGGLTPREQEQNAAILSAASVALCGGSATTDFPGYFQQAQTAGQAVTTGATVFNDAFPSQNAVSLYYTPDGSQGPGQITGSATAATAPGRSTSSGSSTRVSSVTAGSLTSSSSTTPTAGAIATQAAVHMPGIAMAFIGGLAVIV